MCPFRTVGGDRGEGGDCTRHRLPHRPTMRCWQWQPGADVPGAAVHLGAHPMAPTPTIMVSDGCAAKLLILT